MILNQSSVAACSRGLPGLWFKGFFAPKSQMLVQFAIVGYQKIITVCGSCDCKQTCTFHHDLLHRQTAGPESRSFQIMPLIWCSHHCLCIICAGKPCNLLRVSCISDATANLEHRSVASAIEHPWKVNGSSGAEHSSPALQFQLPQQYSLLIWTLYLGCKLGSCVKETPVQKEKPWLRWNKC